MRPVIKIALGLFIFAMNATSANADSEGQYSYVTKVNVTSGYNIPSAAPDYLYIQVAGDLNNADGCTRPTFARSLAPLSSSTTQAQMRIALASLESGADVVIRTSGCDSDGRLVLSQIQIVRN